MGEVKGGLEKVKAGKGGRRKGGGEERRLSCYVLATVLAVGPQGP